MRALTRRKISSSTVALLAAAGFAAPAGAEVAAEVTAVAGEAHLAGQADVEQATRVGDAGELTTGGDGTCSLLVDDDAVLEVCENTRVALDRSGRVRVVRLDAGSIRLVAEPRMSEERIEVHTPAAIATLLGTIVHVEVDPDTGVTTITSAHSDVKVESSDPDVKGHTVVHAMERVAVEPGKPVPEKPIRILQDQLADLDGCLVDFRKRALSDHADDLQISVLDRLAREDRGDLGGPGDEAPAMIAPPGEDPTGSTDVCNVTDCGNEMMSPRRQQYLQQLQLLGY